LHVTVTENHYTMVSVMFSVTPVMKLR